ncbi:MAG: iron-sulfur cluster repair di-iron protein [Chitinophagales bacterium]
MKNVEQQSLSGIVLERHQVIPVFEKYGLDYCCRGKKTLSQACAEKNISLSNVKEEILLATESSKPILPFTEMSAEQLISYILIHHHFYVKSTIPAIINHLGKVVAKHGDRYPKMSKVLQLFIAIKDELEPHMKKEEHILFPRIREVASLLLLHKEINFAPEYISAPIELMAIEHDYAGQLMFEIRDITNNYTAPEDACTTHRVCLEELKAFETDLHQHVHLENNILFPMAAAMMNIR